MQQIGIFFGTETGTTRLVAKKIQARLGEAIAAKPLNVNRIEPADMLQYDALILGTPSYGVGQIPGHFAGCLESNWEEFLAKMPADVSLRGKRIALFGLGAQERYAERFASSLRRLHDVLLGWGAEIVGGWTTEGYTFEQSAALQERYAERFASSLRRLHDVLLGWGAEIIGGWPTEGYTFEQSAAVVDGRFVGLVIDQRTQGMLTDARLNDWVALVRPLLLARLGLAA